MLREDFPDLGSLRKAIPELILRHNLHGIDIDLRSCQIAALALWLRAQRSYQRIGLRPAERPGITRSNVVCAEPMPGEQELLDQFLSDLQPAMIGQLVRAVFEKMKLAGEAGSLLNIEEEIAGAVADSKQKWLAAPKVEQGNLFEGNVTLPIQKEPGPDLSSITDEAFWETAEQHVYTALQAYAERAERGSGYRRRLFAEDAARGFAFIDLCRKHYDVVLMNPPFGKVPPKVEAFMRDRYAPVWTDVYGCFLWRYLDRRQQPPALGCISSSLFLYTKQMRELRSLWIERQSLNLFVELGGGVLDGAAVETAMTVSLSPSSETTWFLDLTEAPDKGARLCSVIHSADVPVELTLAPLTQFRTIYLQPFCYHLGAKKISLWSQPDRLDPQFATVAKGNQTFDDFRFQRLRWEVELSDVNTNWFGYEEGGEYRPYFSPTPVLYNWRRDGAEARAFQIQKFGTDAQVKQSISWWWRPGITYPRVSSVGFGPRAMPAGHVFSGDSISIFPITSDDALPLLAILASSWAEDLSYAFGRYRKIEVRAIANLPLRRDQFQKFRTELGILAAEGFKLVAQLESWSEVSPTFVVPEALSVGTQISDSVPRTRREVSERLMILGDATDARVSDVVFGENETPAIKANTRAALVERYTERGRTVASANSEIISYSLGCIFGRWDIQLATGEKGAPDLPQPFAPLPICPPGMLQNERNLPLAVNDVRRLLAASQWDYPLDPFFECILVDDPDNANDIVRRVRVVLARIWGERAETLEQEACEILGVKDLREYFRKPGLFFADHLKRYSKRRRQAPIYWPLATASGTYTLWVYYHRLRDDSLYVALNRYVKPKIDDIARQIGQLESELPTTTGREATKLRARFEEVKGFLEELRELRDELQRVAALPYRPNLNDGVLITASPLWRLFRLPKWSKDLRECWARLERGEYDWAHLAYSIWPERVREVCRRDRSIAIAHDLEATCEVQVGAEKKHTAKAAMLGNDE